MKYPAGWVEEPTSSPTSSGLISADFHPQEQIGVNVTINRIPSKSLGSDSVTAQEVDQANIDAFKTYRGVNNVQNVQSTTTERTLGGTQWAEEDAQFTDDNNLPYHFMVISVLHNQYYYSLFVYAAIANYSEAMQKYFQPMFDSFQFQS